METGWDKFPWANYKAQDQDGTMWYYQEKPMVDPDSEVFWSTDGVRQQEYNCVPNWKDTLKTRPLPAIRVDEEVIVLIEGKWYVGRTYSNDAKYFIDPYNQDLFSIPITPITTWRYISDLEITL
jgi:hypothetical protein